MRALFAVALVTLTAVGLGALVATSSSNAQPWLGAAIAALGIGAGLWGFADWRRRR